MSPTGLTNKELTLSDSPFCLRPSHVSTARTAKPRDSRCFSTFTRLTTFSPSYHFEISLNLQSHTGQNIHSEAQCLYSKSEIRRTRHTPAVILPPLVLVVREDPYCIAAMETMQTLFRGCCCWRRRGREEE